MTVLEAAKLFMLHYLGDGAIRQPIHFDKDILGVEPYLGVIEMVAGRMPAWNSTVFSDALGELVDEEKVKAWQEEDGQWYYKINITN